MPLEVVKRMHNAPLSVVQIETSADRGISAVTNAYRKAQKTTQETQLNECYDRLLGVVVVVECGVNKLARTAGEVVVDRHIEIRGHCSVAG